MQEELLEEELQMRGAELRVVVFGQAGQPQPEGLKGNAAHLFAAVVQALQKLCGKKTKKSLVDFTAVWVSCLSGLSSVCILANFRLSDQT